MTDAIRERVARALAEAEGYYLGETAAQWSDHWAWYLKYRRQGGIADHSNTARWFRQASAALAIVRAVLLEEAAPPLWTVANHDTYAVLIAPDGHIAARFHVVAECEAVARVLNAMAVFRIAERLAPVKQGEE